MIISEWRKVFKNKLGSSKDVPKKGDCFEPSGELSIDKQLSKIKTEGFHRVFYYRYDEYSKDEVSISLISEKIYVDKPQYL